MIGKIKLFERTARSAYFEKKSHLTIREENKIPEIEFCLHNCPHSDDKCNGSCIEFEKFMRRKQK